MPTHPGAAQQRATAGWYPDPFGPPNQLRWWDGTNWSSNMRTPPEVVLTSKPAEPPQRKRRVIGWAAIGAFALGVSGIVIAVERGQVVCEVSATGIKFCENDDNARREVAQAQPAIEEQASQLESEAQAQGTGAVAADVADITGTWLGDNGLTYVIQQFGNQATFSEIGFGGMTTATGSGFVEDSAYTFDFASFDSSGGTGRLRLDGDTMTGSFTNLFTGITTPLTLRR
jgi:hypothetical protein